MAFFDRAPIPPLNKAVLEYAQSKEGECVGDGECWTLADQALLHANCRRPGRHGNKLYEFGVEIEPGREILPGDILQFERVRFEATDHRCQEMPHHTAIVARVFGTKIWVLNQNVGHVKRVESTAFDLAEKTQGTLQVFRPVQ
jgi:hypothetical protein